jgi:hypothetical protein
LAVVVSRYGEQCHAAGKRVLQRRQQCERCRAS